MNEGTKVRFVNAATGKELGSSGGTLLDIVPRIGDYIDFADGYESSFDVFGEVLHVTWHRHNINDRPTAQIAIAVRDRRAWAL